MKVYDSHKKTIVNFPDHQAKNIFLKHAHVKDGGRYCTPEEKSAYFMDIFSYKSDGIISVKREEALKALENDPVKVDASGKFIGGNYCRVEDVFKYFKKRETVNKEAIKVEETPLPPVAVDPNPPTPVQIPESIEETKVIEETESLEEKLMGMSDEELRQYAQDNGINLGRTKKTNKIIDKILNG